jgi:hypothetical protein
MTQQEAILELAEYDHCFLSPEGVRELGKPFGVFKTIIAKDNRSDFKGLNLGEGNKEGDSAEGLPAHTLAIMICKKLGVDFPYQHGIGSQLRVCCKVVTRYLNEKGTK